MVAEPGSLRQRDRDRQADQRHLRAESARRVHPGRHADRVHLRRHQHRLDDVRRPRRWSTTSSARSPVRRRRWRPASRSRARSATLVARAGFVREPGGGRRRAGDRRRTRSPAPARRQLRHLPPLAVRCSRLQKLVNGEHVPNPPGLNIAAGQPVEFTYVVTNTGQVDLAGLTLLDDRLGGIACPSDQLATGESMTCRAPMQKAILGPYQNTAVMTGRVAVTGARSHLSAIRVTTTTSSRRPVRRRWRWSTPASLWSAVASPAARQPAAPPAPGPAHDDLHQLRPPRRGRRAGAARRHRAVQARGLVRPRARRRAVVVGHDPRATSAAATCSCSRSARTRSRRAPAGPS